MPQPPSPQPVEQPQTTTMKDLAYGGTDVDTSNQGSVHRLERGQPYQRAGRPVVATPKFKALSLVSPISTNVQIPTSSISGILTTKLGAAGSGYAANDTGNILGGNGNANYLVLTVSGGAVVTYQIKASGTGYSVANGVATTPAGAQPGSGKGFTLNIATVSGTNPKSTLVSYPTHTR